MEPAKLRNAMYGGRITLAQCRIGVAGAMPHCRTLRFERGSLLRLMGQPDMPAHELPRWVTMKQAAEHYQLSTRTVRRLISDGQLKARRIGTKTIRIDRESLLKLGEGKDFWWSK